MNNFLQKKIKIFPDWLENKVAKVFILSCIIIVPIFILYFCGESIFERNKCESRDLKWFSIPLSSKLGQDTYELTLAETKGHYREIYLSGVCANMK